MMKRILLPVTLMAIAGSFAGGKIAAASDRVRVDTETRYGIPFCGSMAPGGGVSAGGVTVVDHGAVTRPRNGEAKLSRVTVALCNNAPMAVQVEVRDVHLVVADAEVPRSERYSVPPPDAVRTALRVESLRIVETRTRLVQIGEDSDVGPGPEVTHACAVPQAVAGHEAIRLPAPCCGSYAKESRYLKQLSLVIGLDPARGPAIPAGRDAWYELHLAWDGYDAFLTVDLIPDDQEGRVSPFGPAFDPGKASLDAGVDEAFCSAFRVNTADGSTPPGNDVSAPPGKE